MQRLCGGGRRWMEACVGWMSDVVTVGGVRVRVASTHWRAEGREGPGGGSIKGRCVDCASRISCLATSFFTFPKFNSQLPAPSYFNPA